MPPWIDAIRHRAYEATANAFRTFAPGSDGSPRAARLGRLPRTHRTGAPSIHGPLRQRGRPQPSASGSGAPPALGSRQEGILHTPRPEIGPSSTTNLESLQSQQRVRSPMWRRTRPDPRGILGFSWPIDGMARSKRRRRPSLDGLWRACTDADSDFGHVGRPDHSPSTAPS